MKKFEKECFPLLHSTVNCPCSIRSIIHKLCMSHFFDLDNLIVLLAIPEPVLLSVLSLTGCCICTSYSRVFMYCTSSSALRKSDSLSASAAELVTAFITLART